MLHICSVSLTQLSIVHFRCYSLFVSWMWLIAQLLRVVLVLHCNAMLSWVVVMVKSKDLRLVWEVHKP